MTTYLTTLDCREKPCSVWSIACIAIALGACSNDTVAPKPTDAGDASVVSDGATGDVAPAIDATIRDATGDGDDGTADATTSDANDANDANVASVEDASDARGSADASDASDPGSSADASDAGDGAVPEALLVATVNNAAFTSKVTTIDLARSVVVGAADFAGTQTLPYVRDGRRFVLEFLNDILAVIDANGAAVRTIALRPDGGAWQNPDDIAVLPGTSKAFVPFGNTGVIACVDVDAGAVTGRIDLTSFTDPSDTDGSPDISALVYVPATGLLYATLKRLNSNACGTTKSLIVAIDPTTKAVVDVHGDAGAGLGIPLRFEGPSSAWYDVANSRLVVLSSGCIAATGRRFGGIESVPLTGSALGTTTALYTSPDGETLAQLIALDSTHALVATDDPSLYIQWRPWDWTSAALGAVLANVPVSVVFETPDSVVGARSRQGVDGGVQGYDAIRYRVSTGQSTIVATDPAGAPYVNGVALVP